MNNKFVTTICQQDKRGRAGFGAARARNANRMSARKLAVDGRQWPVEFAVANFNCDSKLDWPTEPNW